MKLSIILTALNEEGNIRQALEDLLQALEFGMPPASGVAMGLDRLVMLATGAKNIDEVLWLPVVEPDST